MKGWELHNRSTKEVISFSPSDSEITVTLKPNGEAWASTTHKLYVVNMYCDTDSFYNGVMGVYSTPENADQAIKKFKQEMEELELMDELKNIYFGTGEYFINK